MCYTDSVKLVGVDDGKVPPVPFRTQKLSLLVPKIVSWKRLVKIGSRRLLIIRMKKPHSDNMHLQLSW